MTTQKVYEKYMQRCLELAAKGCGHVAPNPMVGAVIVHEDTIIGEGYHCQYGCAHAEANAVASVRDLSLLSQSTLYVNLEPCSHFGKTPPCAQLIIDKKIPRVVVGITDPYPEIAGRGLRMMQDAGVEVITGILEEACEDLNKRFLTFHRRKRPYIFLKWAQSADGYLDLFREPGDGKEPVHFSSGLTRMMLHKRRAEEVSVMVGTHTALLDDPSLTVRYWYGKHPLRIVIDKELTVPGSSHLLDNTSPTLVFTQKKQGLDVLPHSLSFEDVFFKNQINYCYLDFDRDILPQVLDVLYQAKIQSLIVEGGAILLESFLQAEIWDEISVEKAFCNLGSGVKAPLPDREPDSIGKCEKSNIYHYTNWNLPKIL